MEYRKFNEKWRKCKLYDLATWKNGLAFKQISFSNKGYPIIKIAELKNGITKQTNYTKQNYDKNVFLTYDDLIFSWSGNPETSIDAFLYRLPDGYLNQHSFKVTPKDGIDKYFLYYILKYLKPVFKSIATNKQTTGLGHVTIGNLKELDVAIPDYIIQRKILKILKNIDNKIELNNKINNNLQELILTLYKKFIEDNIEAEEVTLEDCVKKIGTGADAIQRAPIVDYDTGIRCIRVGDMTNNRKCYEWGFAKMTDKDFNNYKLDIGDIVITRTAVNGLSYLIEDSMNIVCNNGLIRLKVNEKYNLLYIYLTMKTKDFYNYIHRIDSETSVRPNMKVDYLTSYKIKKISLEKQNQFCDMIKSMRQRQKEIEYENNNLTQLRDTLLPKLMNGEIDLDNIEI